MKLRLLILFMFFLIINYSFGQNKLDSLLSELDIAIKEHTIYSTQKNSTISLYKAQLSGTKHYSPERYELNQKLYSEYKSYICDSAITYLNSNIEIASNLKDKEKENESKIQLSKILGSSGMYKEASDVLSSIEIKHLSPSLLSDYYIASDHVYGELAYYTQDKVSSLHYDSIARAYKDSLFNLLPLNDVRLQVMLETSYRDSREFDRAMDINDSRLRNTGFGAPGFALIAFHRALLYREKKERQNEKYYLALSALSDIKSSTKDHASLWMLAQMLYEDEDIERAYNYIRFSWSETVFYNARLRSLQSAGILSLIDKTYQALVEKQKNTLQRYLIIISLLLIMLVAALLYIYRQMKKLSVARNNLQSVNQQLKKLNQDLSDINTQLKHTNEDLCESNQIKEEYIGRFLKLCSSYIDKLDTYRKMVYKKASDGKIQDLIKITRSPDSVEEELKEFYHNFDTAFLQIFPDFVNKFNSLLQEKEHIVLKRGELLNTELRIFALIRLGFDDSSQIAEFLRYSVNTIYNYRAKVKNKACVLRDNFEELVKQIR